MGQKNLLIIGNSWHNSVLHDLPSCCKLFGGYPIDYCHTPKSSAFMVGLSRDYVRCWAVWEGLRLTITSGPYHQATEFFITFSRTCCWVLAQRLHRKSWSSPPSLQFFLALSLSLSLFQTLEKRKTGRGTKVITLGLLKKV